VFGCVVHSLCLIITLYFSVPFLMVQKEEGRENVLVEIFIRKC
jgi:hypothetical protein